MDHAVYHEGIAAHEQYSRRQLDDEEHEDDEEDREDNIFRAAATPSSPASSIAAPAPVDVICGRGKMTSSHPGNRRFRELVLEKKQAYQRARRRDDKTRITFELVQTLRDGGR